VRPVPIPEGLGFEGGETKTIRGGDTGAQDVECCVGHTPEGVPFFAYLITCSADDLRNLHLDPRFWVVQLGSPSLYPHAFTPAFVTPAIDELDPETQELTRMGDLVSAAWLAREEKDQAKLAVLLSQISTAASRALFALPSSKGA
jgi:hypothetical protein